MGSFKNFYVENKLKVGSWWNKFDDKQKEYFSKLWYSSKYPDIQFMRKFFTSAKKIYGDKVEYLGANGLIKIDDKKYMYSSDLDKWILIQK